MVVDQGRGDVGAEGAGDVEDQPADEDQPAHEWPGQRHGTVQERLRRGQGRADRGRDRHRHAGDVLRLAHRGDRTAAPPGPRLGPSPGSPPREAAAPDAVAPDGAVPAVGTYQ